MSAAFGGNLQVSVGERRLEEGARKVKDKNITLYQGCKLVAHTVYVHFDAFILGLCFLIDQNFHNFLSFSPQFCYLPSLSMHYRVLFPIFQGWYFYHRHLCGKLSCCKTNWLWSSFAMKVKLTKNQRRTFIKKHRVKHKTTNNKIISTLLQNRKYLNTFYLFFGFFFSFFYTF